MKEENYKFEIGKKVMLKENLLLVEIVERKIHKRQNLYIVKYPHLKNARTFPVYEDEIEEKPIDYHQVIFDAYIEYRCKYIELLKRLYSPAFRDKY